MYNTLVDESNEYIRTFNKALDFLNRMRPEKAIPMFKKLEKTYQFKEIYLNLGTAYRYQDRDDLSKQMFLKAADPMTPFADGTFTDIYTLAMNNLGLLSYVYENDALAIAYYRTALKKDPEYWDATWNLGSAILREYYSRKRVSSLEGWDLYETRFSRKAGVKLKNTRSDLMLWDAKSHTDGIIILGEQGYGDLMMFSRYLKHVPTSELIVQCPNALKDLYTSQGYRTCLDTAEVPHIKYAYPIGSLAKLYGEVPEKWIDVGSHVGGKIGCVWSGNPNHANDRNRSCPVGYFRSLGLDMYNLNPANVGTKGFKDCAPAGWLPTAEKLLEFDLIISVDTAIVHLAGSMGIPCLVIMPLRESDFRWGDSSMGTDNMWYSSVKVIRNNGNWFDTMRAVEKCLK